MQLEPFTSAPKAFDKYGQLASLYDQRGPLSYGHRYCHALTLIDKTLQDGEQAQP
jgi:hypothetical protein